MKAVTVAAVPARRPRISTLWRVAPHGQALLRPGKVTGLHQKILPAGLQRWLEENSPVRRVMLPG